MSTEINLFELITKDKLITIINSISDGVFTLDKDFNITFMNKTAEEIIGISLSEALGKRCKDVFKVNICEDQCALLQTIKTGKPIVNKSVCLINNEDQRVPISISTALLKNNKGEVIGGVETFRDLRLVETLRKELEESYSFEDMIGRSREMREMFKLLPIVAESDSTILIEGESGTGKELVARAIHSLSSRKKGPMITVNSSAIPDTIMESELFGYKAGAFTDAKKDKKGKFALADGGTLFLDEVGEISPVIQVKMLRVLQERTYEPLGGTESENANVRILAATNKKLDALVDEGKFRKDLFYRINVVRLHLPPLRERREDISLLVDHFIGKFNSLRNKNIAGITPIALNRLLKHDFPGNVRELENIIEYAFVMSPGGVIKPEHLPDYLQEKQAIPAVEIAQSFHEMESLFIIAALKRNNWSRKDAARELGINPSTLFRKIKKLKLNLPGIDGRKK